MINIDDLSFEEFKKLPLIVEGESKEIRDIGAENGIPLCAIRLKPTIYSFTHNRTGVVEGSDLLRLRATKTFIDVLQRSGISHAYHQVGEKFILSERIISPPNIEVIVKQFHSGTSKHRYYGMDKATVRENSPFSGMTFGPEQAYPHPVVRFDWRNPFWHPKKVEELRKENPNLPVNVFDWPDELKNKIRLADEIMCEDVANWFINVKEAKKTALDTFYALSVFLTDRDIMIYDLCLFIDSSGKKVYGEISQDCGRFRHFDLGSLDKDVWRSGCSSEQVLQKWSLLNEMIEL